MERREFLRDTVSTIAAFSGSAAPRGQTLAIANDSIQWEFNLADRKLSSFAFTNKLSSKRYPIRPVSELRLSFSAARDRMEIPFWRCTFGPDGDSTAPEQEQGLRNGFHLPRFDDSRWPTCPHPALPRLTAEGDPPRGRPPLVYSGYGWFRTKFELPAAAQGQEVFITLGGYDQTDWLEHWVFVNGVAAGRQSARGRWRSPKQYRMAPGSPEYQALRFGGSQPNVLTLRTHGYDRHFDGLSDDVLNRYLFNFPHAPNSGFYDQFVTVGAPYLHISDFEVLAVRQQGPEKIAFDMRAPEGDIRATLNYQLEGPVRRKWVEVINDGPGRKLLLDVDLDAFATEGRTADGGSGFPLTVDEQIFCAVEHPSGLNRGDGASVSLTHFPGKWLEPGKGWRSSDALLGVAPPRQAHQAFLEYIESRTVRKKKFLALYDSLGITAFPLGLNWTMNEEQNLRTLELFDQWAKKGMKFDYYSAELSLDMTASGDLKRLRLFSYPDGPEKMVARMNEMGIGYGQYFSVCGGNWSLGRNPKVYSCRIPEPGPNPPSKVVYRHGYPAGGTGLLCPAAEPYFSMFKEAVAHHCRKYKAALLKFDIGRFYCTSTKHEHLPGKYSTEEHYNRLIELAKTAREVNPDVMIIWYWGAYSPFFALHGDAVQDTRIDLEGATVCDYPAMFFRDSATQALDQATQFAKWLPPINHDSLGIWLANNAWGNYMGAERWREATVMDLGRGSLLFPQIWSDVYQLEEADVAFLARLQGVAKRNEKVFLRRRRSIGDAWKEDIYGYSYFLNEHGFVFLNNMSFASRRIRLELGAQIGLEAIRGTPLRLRLHFPEEAILTHSGNADFQAGAAAEIQLRPFEVMMLEVSAAGLGLAGAGGDRDLAGLLLPHGDAARGLPGGTGAQLRGCAGFAKARVPESRCDPSGQVAQLRRRAASSRYRQPVSQAQRPVAPTDYEPVRAAGRDG